MYDELVKRLREPCQYENCILCQQAADAIEELRQQVEHSVPVPPHGRLIDADALMKHKGDCYDAKGHLLYAIGTGNIMCAPTIIPAEEGET